VTWLQSVIDFRGEVTIKDTIIAEEKKKDVLSGETKDFPKQNVAVAKA